MAVTAIELTTPEAVAAGARSTLYRALARGFRAPTPAYAQEVQAGRVAEEIRQAAAALPYRLEVPELSGAPYEALESAHLALFEVGGEEGAPCFLYEGEHGGGRMKVLDDVLRFYHYFDLRLSEERRDRPDHLATELEFLHALTFKEAAELARGGSVGPLRQAQRDFLRFHLEEFTAAVAERLAGRRAPFYPALAALAAAFCRAERAYLG